MTRSKTLWAVVATIFVTIMAAAYVFAQYELAQKPASLNDLPAYPFVGSAYPIDDVALPDRTRAETTLRHFATAVEPGYRPTGERFLASKGEFIWDAVRNSVGGYLSDTSFRTQNIGQTRQNDHDFAYVAWARTNRLQRWFKPTQILAVGLQDPVGPAQAGDQVHVYAYFETTPA